MKISTAPLARVTVPVKVPPETALIPSLELAKRRLWVAQTHPDEPRLQALPVASTKLLVCPPQLITAAVTVVPAVPVFESVTKLPAGFPHVKLVPAFVDRKSPALRNAAVTATCAEFVDEPKTPKMNPAIATEATRVTATMRTVATMGEMASLPLRLTRFTLITVSARSERFHIPC